MALRAKKYPVAFDVLERLSILIEADDRKPIKDFFTGWFDQSYEEITLAALKDNKPDVANIAAGKISDSLRRAEALRKIASHYFNKKNFTAASSALKSSLKAVKDGEDGNRKILTLLRLTSAFQKIDKTGVAETIEMTARLLDSFPAPKAEDKPDGEIYQKYVESVIFIDAELIGTLEELLPVNKIEANSLADRLNRKEFKVAASWALLREKLKSMETAPQIK